MSMVSKTLCNHFACQGSYSTTHTLGLNFTIKSWAESLAIMSVIITMALTWSEHNYCEWFDGTICVCEQPALVCHGSQSRFHLCGVTVVHWTWICFSMCANLKPVLFNCTKSLISYRIWWSMYTVLGKASYTLPFPSLGKDTLHWLYVCRLCTL